jgi:hypothetical protein
MNVVIDKSIEKHPDRLDDVRRANSYLESQLGPFKNEVEARWSTPADRLDDVSLTLRFTDNLPGEASDSFSAKVLNPDRMSALWLRSVVNVLFGRRAEVHLSQVRHMLDQLENDELANGAEACQSPH